MTHQKVESQTCLFAAALCEITSLFDSTISTNSNNLNLRLRGPQGPVWGNSWLLHQTISSELFVIGLFGTKKIKKNWHCAKFRIVLQCSKRVVLKWTWWVAAGQPAALMSGVDFGWRSTVWLTDWAADWRTDGQTFPEQRWKQSISSGCCSNDRDVCTPSGRAVRSMDHC